MKPPWACTTLFAQCCGSQWLCSVILDVPDRRSGSVPGFLPGLNQFLIGGPCKAHGVKVGPGPQT